MGFNSGFKGLNSRSISILKECYLGAPNWIRRTQGNPSRNWPLEDNSASLLIVEKSFLGCRIRLNSVLILRRKMVLFHERM